MPKKRIETMSETLQIRVTPTFMRRLKHVAEEKGINMHELVRGVLSEWVDWDKISDPKS